MPYCTNCGNEVTPEMLYCQECGGKLIPTQVEQEDNEPLDYATDAEVSKQEARPAPRIRRGKLYKQWVQHANLPNEETSSIRSPSDIPAREGSKAQHPYLMYTLLGVATLLCIGLVFLLIKSW